MISYILQVSLCWLGFYLFYALLLKKETFFRANRIYLLSTLIAGLIIPLLNVSSPLPASASDFANVYLEPITVGVQQIDLATQENFWKASFSFLNGVLFFYIVGLLFFSYRFIHGISTIVRLYKDSVITKKEGYTFVHTKQDHLPFSFFNYLFWSNEMPLDTIESDKIIAHELAHINERHSLDVILVELLSILLWCIPFVHLYKRAIKDTHEFLADAAVLQHTEVRTYGYLLLKQIIPGLQFQLANNFIQSQLKNRIAMMTKCKSQPNAMKKYLLALPLCFVFLFFFSCQEETTNDVISTTAPTTETAVERPIASTTSDEIFKQVDEMPRFPGCEDIADLEERKQCSTKKMLEYIYKSIKYPAEARENGVEGTVVIRFVVDQTGSIVEPQVVREIGSGCDAEVMRIVSEMENINGKWIPGLKDQREVSVYYNLPVKFKLE